MEVYWVRHTQVDVAKAICYGQLDVSLALTFEEELFSLQSQLPKRAKCFSSPLQRCLKLAEALYPNEAIKDIRLLEYHFGNWEGKAWDEIPARELNPWMEHFVNQRPPSGETYHELKKRVVSFVEEIRYFPQNDLPLVVVTHAGVLRSVLSHLLSIPLEQTFKLQLDYGVVFKTDLNMDARLDRVWGM